MPPSVALNLHRAALPAGAPRRAGATWRRRLTRAASSLGLAASAAACSGGGNPGTEASLQPAGFAGSPGNSAGTAAGGAGNAAPGTGGEVDPSAVALNGGMIPGSSCAPAATGGSGSMAPTPVGSTTSAADPSCQVGATPILCGGANGPTRAPENGLLVDFVSYLAAGSWGDSTVGQITGGSSLYSGNTSSALSATSERGTLHLKANISARGYAGIVLWTGPCIDASMYNGLRFKLAGNLGGSALQLKVQTNVNYPVSVGGVNKGACAYTSCEGRWGECVPPFAAITAIDAAAPERFLRWSDFGGGLPSAGLTPGSNQIVGLELQFQCQAATDCPLDVSLGTIAFDRPTLPSELVPPG